SQLPAGVRAMRPASSARRTALSSTPNSRARARLLRAMAGGGRRFLRCGVVFKPPNSSGSGSRLSRIDGRPREEPSGSRRRFRPADRPLPLAPPRAGRLARATAEDDSRDDKRIGVGTTGAGHTGALERQDEPLLLHLGRVRFTGYADRRRRKAAWA